MSFKVHCFNFSLLLNLATDLQISNSIAHIKQFIQYFAQLAQLNQLAYLKYFLVSFMYWLKEIYLCEHFMGILWEFTCFKRL